MSSLGPDENTIRATWRWLAHGAHGVSEVRVIRPAGGIIGIGFFDDEDAFVRECMRTNAAGNVYVGIQPRPRRLLEMAPNVVRPLKTGIGYIDKMGMMEVVWYTGQLKRIGRGEPPKPGEMPLWVFVKYIAKQAGLGRKKGPAKLRATT